MESNAGVALLPAPPEVAEELTQIAMTSKAHWGYSEAFMQSCLEELTVHQDDLLDPLNICGIAKLVDTVAGYYLLTPKLDAERPCMELEALFVLPEFMGQGVGRALFEDAVAQAKSRDCEAIDIQSDPSAESFYKKMGAEKYGETPSHSIADRKLPQLLYLVQ